MVSYLSEVVATPTASPFSVIEDVVSFGNEIPSPSAEYADQQRKIKQTYDTGLTNSLIGIIQGVPSAAGKFAASPLWGLSSLIGSGLTLGRDLQNLSMNRKNALSNISASYITSSIGDWYNYVLFVDAFNNHEILNSDSDNKSLYEPYLVKKFTESQKHQLRFIIQNYGFKLNMCIPFNVWYELLEDKDIAFIQFNSEWLNTAIPQINLSGWNIEVQDVVNKQLSNGIRMHMEWK